MRKGLIDILIGTQIISKGHHFPLLTCVGVIDADLGMANGDLRAAERTYQLLHQVSGRTGREKRPGKSFLQTYFPAHPVIKSLVEGEKEKFQEAELKTRENNNLPPYGRLASIILSDTNSFKLIEYCNQLKKSIPKSDHIIVLGPVPAPMTKVRGRTRYRFLLKAGKETNIQKYLDSINIKILVRVLKYLLYLLMHTELLFVVGLRVNQVICYGFITMIKRMSMKSTC